jgi:restriction system protein
MRRILRSAGLEVFGGALLAAAVALAFYLWLGAVAAAIGAAVVVALLGAGWIDRAAVAWVRRRGLVAMDRMSGVEFERHLGVLFADLGYRVRATPVTGDFGADLLLARGGTHTCVQAKRVSRPVGITAVQEAIGARLHYGADAAIVVATSTFTPAAKALAESGDVDLWDRDRIASELLAVRR